MSAWKKYEVTVTKRWTVKGWMEPEKKMKLVLPNPEYRMAHSEKQAAAMVKREYDKRYGVGNVYFTCEAEEVEG